MLFICHHIIHCHHHPRWCSACHYSLMTVAVCYRNIEKSCSHLASVCETFGNYIITCINVMRYIYIAWIEIVCA